MSKPRAFIIEDDEVITKIFATAVREAEFETTVILDGVEALEKLKSEIPDLILLDLHLPGVSGIHILREIKADQKFSNTRIVIVSADTAQSEFLRVHADEILIKPVGFRILRDTAAKYNKQLK